MTREWLFSALFLVSTLAAAGCSSTEDSGLFADVKEGEKSTTTDCTATACSQPDPPPPAPAPAAAGSDAKPKTGTKVMGDSCKDASQCAEATCIGVVSASEGFCSRSCVNSTDCPSRWGCQTMQSGGRACFPKGEKLTGEACSGSTDCASEHCVVLQGATLGYCSIMCTTATQCPVDWSCELPQGASYRLCAQP